MKLQYRELGSDKWETFINSTSKKRIDEAYNWNTKNAKVNNTGKVWRILK